jgi:hypothetical protein
MIDVTTGQLYGVLSFAASWHCGQLNPTAGVSADQGLMLARLPWLTLSAAALVAFRRLPAPLYTSGKRC